MYASGEPRKYIINGERASAIIEPTETYLVVYVIVPQITAIISPATQLRARIVPTPDATDFPPLNPKNIDLLCPIITNIEAITGAIPNFAPAWTKRDAKITGSAPLKASSKRTIKNHFLPSTLLTFVAPVEPEPIVLISCPVFDLTIKYPVDIEPIKYEITAVKTNSKIFIIILNSPYNLLYLKNNVFEGLQKK